MTAVQDMTARQGKTARQDIFTTPFSLNEQLIGWAHSEASHGFLANPSSHLIYVYLVNFVKSFSENWFKNSFSQLQTLDWGCGKGHVSYLLKSLGGQVTSADRAVPQGDSAFGQVVPIIRNAGLEIVALNDSVTLPFADNSYDIVLSFGVLEHVENDQASLCEVQRILKPKGLFFCFDLPYFLSWTQRLAHLRGNYYHERLYSKKQVKNMLCDAQFVLLEIWHRQLFPKNSVRYKHPYLAEKIDLFLTEHTPLKFFATNIEFVACKPA